MEITTRSLWTLIHGMGFGALFLLAGSGALVLLWQRRGQAEAHPRTAAEGRLLGWYLAMMAALAWLTVLTGTYIIYPWYRTPPPPGTRGLGAYPRALLLSSPSTSAWHSVGMEWKEHIAWLVPIVITMAAIVAIRYRDAAGAHRHLRSTLTAFVASSLVAAGLAGFLGALIDKAAPVVGGSTLPIVRGRP